MCSHGDPSWQPDKGMMPTETAKHIIDQCVTAGVFSVKLQFRGESMLHKDVIEIIKYAKDAGILEVQMNTNGIPFTQEKVKAMILAGLDRLIVSIDGATPDTYRIIRIGGELDKVARTLSWFRHFKRQLNSKTPSIRLQMTQQKENTHEADKFRKNWSMLADEVLVKPIRESNTGERKSCPQPRQRLVYAWNGDVLGCCNAWNNESLISKHVKGISDWSMRILWNYRISGLREQALNPNGGEPCRSCKVRSSFK